MMRLGNADMLVGADARFAADHQSGDPRQIGLECQVLQIENQFGMLDKIHGRASRSVGGRPGRGPFFIEPLNAPFRFPDEGQVFLELAAVLGTDACRQALGLVDGPIEDALAVTSPPGSRGRIQVQIDIAKQAVENKAGIGHGRQGRGRRPPADAVGIRAGESRIAMAHGAVVVQAQFERGQPRLSADSLGCHLVRRYAHLEVGAAGFAGLGARQKAGAGTGVVAAPRGNGVVGRETAQDQRVLPERFQRFEDGREGKVPPRGGGLPIRHDHAIGDVHEGKTQGPRPGHPLRPTQGGHHGVQEGQANHGAGAPQKGPARQVLSGNDHGLPRLPCCIWKGML